MVFSDHAVLTMLLCGLNKNVSPFSSATSKGKKGKDSKKGNQMRAASDQQPEVCNILPVVFNTLKSSVLALGYLQSCYQYKTELVNLSKDNYSTGLF